ncbi:hypothetical protein FBR05_02140 [Deltaproteobacteria bacterium PRO3]|nr:hypothetical protein [Deltaproteobacteria bacterium PRO3]
MPIRKLHVAAGLLLVALIFPGIFVESLQGANGPMVSGSGGACGRKSPPPVADADGDGFEDAKDNCPQDFNPSQLDVDGDGIGEVCESFQPLDGKIDCELGPCTSNESCEAALSLQCPEDYQELQFLGLFLACCDGACVIGDVESPSGGCPAGTCNTPFPHCGADDECFAAGLGPCLEGCCMPPPPLPCECECPPEDPECECPPCEIICPSGLPPPECESSENCGPEEICAEPGCCAPIEPPPPPPPPMVISFHFLHLILAGGTTKAGLTLGPLYPAA